MANPSKNMRFEDVSSYSSSKEYKKKKKNRRGGTFVKSVIAVISVLLIVAGGGMVYLSADIVPNIRVQAITKDRNELMIREEATMDDSITNIALFGLDSRNDSFKGLSDSIMVLTVDNKHGKIKLTSVLRDSKVEIAGYGNGKINSAYSDLAYPADGGPELAVKTLNHNFMLNITDYVTINFGNMAKIVDAFGGVRMVMDDEEAYQTNENINALMYEQIHLGLERTIWESDFLPIDEYGEVKGGEFLLNGNQAVGYARNRTDSDMFRSERQKNVLMGLLDRVGDLETSDYYNLAKEILPMCETSLDLKDIMNLLPILNKNIVVETLTIPGDEEQATGGVQDDFGWVFEYDLGYAAQHIDRFIYEDGSRYWQSAAASQSAGGAEPYSAENEYVEYGAEDGQDGW